MTEVVAEALGQGGGSGDGAGGGDNGAPATPAWMTGLTNDELRADPDLTRYGSLDDLAKGLKETRTWARGRVAIPGADDDAGWKEFGEKMRPEKASDYDVPVPEGQDTAMADKFREFAHAQGMPPRWVKAVAEFNNQFQSDIMSRHNQQGADGLKAVELELGAVGYNQRIEAVNGMMQSAGFGDDLADVVKGLESAYGSEKTMRFLFAMAEKTGELGKVDPINVNLRLGGMAPESAQAEIDRLSADKEFIKKASVKGSAEAKKWDDLNLAASQRKK